jgi:hypothetical protein
MKLKVTLAALILSLASMKIYSQDAEKPGLEVSGSVDTYYKYDFSGMNQIPTYYGEEQNGIGIGMLDVSLSQAVGKASFVGEVAFGPRAAESAPGPVQNLYVDYKFSDLFSVTAGFMATYVGYEVISPVPNFNYSTSYLFSNGPFQNGGVKGNFHFSDKFGLMVGVFNHFDSYTNDGAPLSFGTQLYVSPVENMNIYINLASSHYSGEELDLTANFQATDKFLVGLNVAKRSEGFLLISQEGTSLPDFFGVAGYLDYNFTDAFGLGLRYENFKDNPSDVSINSITLSGNINAGPLRIIPEIRMDSGSEDIFTDSDSAPVKSATQALIAAVYSF